MRDLITRQLMIKEQLPSMLSKRIFELSFNREEFAWAATLYNIAMKTNDYHSNRLLGCI